jgi:hypothetical protein
VEQTQAGETLAIDYAGSELLLDPAGVAYFSEDRILVVSDMHLEKGSSFARSRIYLPPYDTAATLARLAAMAPNTIRRRSSVSATVSMTTKPRRACRTKRSMQSVQSHRAAR